MYKESVLLVLGHLVFCGQRTLHCTSALNTVYREPCPPCWVMAPTWIAGTNKAYLRCMLPWRSGVELIRSLATRLFIAWWRVDTTRMSICLTLMVLSCVFQTSLSTTLVVQVEELVQCVSVCLSVCLSVGLDSNFWMKWLLPWYLTFGSYSHRLGQVWRSLSLIKVDGYRMKNVAEVDGIGVTMSGGFLVVIVPCNAISCDFQQNVTP